MVWWTRRNCLYHRFTFTAIWFIWYIFRTAEQVGNKKITYAFPNPFSPNNEPVRLHYSLSTGTAGTQAVSIRIFDYAMLPVRTLIQNASRA